MLKFKSTLEERMGSMEQVDFKFWSEEEGF